MVTAPKNGEMRQKAVSMILSILDTLIFHDFSSSGVALAVIAEAFCRASLQKFGQAGVPLALSASSLQAEESSLQSTILEALVHLLVHPRTRFALFTRPLASMIHGQKAATATMSILSLFLLYTYTFLHLYCRGTTFSIMN